MKFLLVLAAVATVVVSSAIPLIPGDNSHYVEGESRYVWIPDGSGGAVLADLHAPVDESAARFIGDTQYWLFTRQNANRHQVITNGNVNSIRASNYVASRPLKVILHGYAGNGNSQINNLLVSAFLAVVDANVIVVDWRRLASANYVTAVQQAPALGRAVGGFITWLISNGGGNWNNVHISGFSLGGQVAGNAGRATNGRARRVTGLDPMSPMWYHNADVIRANAGQYVEIIHTNYNRNNSPRIGDADFYPNGGRNQPGCSNSICNHNRSFHLFAQTIRRNDLVGRQCTNLQQAQSNRCTGPTLNMGNSILTKRGIGFFALSTRGSSPF